MFNVVVGVCQSRTSLTTQHSGRAVGYHLDTGVGIGGCAGPGLEDIHDELVVDPVVGHVPARFGDGFTDLFVKQPSAPC